MRKLDSQRRNQDTERERDGGLHESWIWSRETEMGTVMINSYIAEKNHLPSLPSPHKSSPGGWKASRYILGNALHACRAHDFNNFFFVPSLIHIFLSFYMT